MIKEILEAKHLMQVCNINTWEADFKTLAMRFHPDKCKDPQASDVMSKLNSLRHDYLEGWTLSDDAGVYTSNGYTHCWKGEKTLREKSEIKRKDLVQNLGIRYKDEALEHFMKYICPEPVELDTITKVETKNRYIPLSKVYTLLQNVEHKEKHIYWIYSRMIEFCATLSSLSVNHTGINIDSVFVNPVDHSIRVMTFYHLMPMGKRLSTISGRWSTFYPEHVFRKKESRPGIDVTLAKKTAIYLLGDSSGSGVLLRNNKDINPHVLEHLLTPEEDGRDAMDNWRKVIKNNFKSEFLILNI